MRPVPAALRFFAPLVAAAVLAAASARAADERASAYPYRIEPSILDSMKKGPNAQVYFYRQVVAMVKSDTPVDSINFTTVSARVQVYGKYNSPRGPIDLEILGAVTGGLFEVDFPLGRIDAALFDWEEMAARPEPLKSFRPRVRSVTFREDLGFRTIYSLERDFPYQLTVDLPYNPVTKNLMPAQPGFDEVADFIKSMESDDRARAILSNNATGLPAFIVGGDETTILVAGYLLNSITWNGRTGRWEYRYDESLKRLRGLREVKRLLKNPGVRAFVEKSDDVRLKGVGSDKTGFRFWLTRDGGERLEATLVGRRVTVVPAPSPKQRP